MWLITTLIAAIITSILWYKYPKYRLEVPAIMFWGCTMMVLVDHILGYEGGPFLELETDGLVTNGIVLGLLMMIPVIAVWVITLVIKKPKK
jgi:hypothetical protein